MPTASASPPYLAALRPSAHVVVFDNTIPPEVVQPPPPSCVVSARVQSYQACDSCERLPTSAPAGGRSLRDHLSIFSSSPPVRRHHYLSKFQPHPNADTQLPRYTLVDEGALLITAEEAQERQRRKAGKVWLSGNRQQYRDSAAAATTAEQGTTAEQEQQHVGRRRGGGLLHRSVSCFPGSLRSRSRPAMQRDIPPDYVNSNNCAKDSRSENEQRFRRGSTGNWVELTVPQWLLGGGRLAGAPRSATASRRRRRRTGSDG
eukprot:GHVS01104115.1.p1 GENE.GHVS01104115.1~~GHVS01104115.1.p1  ORF type:complete len:260 (+),score=51.96 GHVS01104115.1:198-977(+)